MIRDDVRRLSDTSSPTSRLCSDRNYEPNSSHEQKPFVGSEDLHLSDVTKADLYEAHAVCAESFAYFKY